MELVTGAVVVGFGLALVSFAGVIAMRPRTAERFLAAFASSARMHYLEQLLRLIVGVALVAFSPSMSWSVCFEILGWLMTVTAVGLLLVPWRWHHRFGQWAIPLAIRHMKWYGLSAAALGALLLWATARPLLV